MSDHLPSGGIREYLVQLVNAKEGLSLDYEGVQFGNPTLLDGTILDFSHPTNRNSRVIITQPSEEFPPLSVVVNYNRLSLPKLFTNYSTTFAGDPSNTTLSQYLPQINQRLGSSLSADDIVNQPVDITGGNVTVSLTGSSSSLYVFGTISLTIEASTSTEEEDMYYTLVPAESQWGQNGDGTFRTSFGSSAGDPMFLKSSNPEDFVVHNLSDLTNLSNLVLEKAEFFYNAALDVDVTSSMRSVYDTGNSSFGASTQLYMRAGAPNGMVKLGDLVVDVANTTGQVLGLKSEDDSWFGTYNANGGRMILVRAVYTDPALIDSQDRPVKAYHYSAFAVSFS